MCEEPGIHSDEFCAREKERKNRNDGGRLWKKEKSV
jgi:hypothetical protein